MFDKKGIVWFVAAVVFSFLIYLLIPIFSKQIPFFTHIVFQHYISQLQKIIIFLPVVVLLYAFLPIRKILDYYTYLRRIKEWHFLVAIFVLSLLITNLISYYVYEHIPQGDGIIAFYQAKIFSQGQRWVKAPIYLEFFIRGMVENNGKWFAMIPPGHPLVLALGVILRVPWLIGPLLGSFSLLIFYFLLRGCFGIQFAKEGSLFLLLSPTFLFIAPSFLSQNSSFFFLLLGMFFLVRAIKSKSIFYPLLSGLSVGFAFLSRPGIPLAFLITSIVFLAILRRKGMAHRLSTFFLILGFLPLLLFQLLDNYSLTGNALHYGYSLFEVQGLHSIGFGLGKGRATFGIYAHTLFKALVNFSYNGFVFSLHLFGWPLLSLIFVAAALLKPAKCKWTLFAFGVIGVTIILLGLYWFHGISPMGPKYYYEILPFLVILTIIGLNKLKWNARPLVGLLFLLSITMYTPQNTKIFKIWGTNLNCYNEVKKLNLHHAIVFMKDLPGEDEITETINRYNYPSVSFRNEIEIEKSDIVYARDLEGDKNKLLMQLYSDRKVYRFEYIGDIKHWHIVPYKIEKVID